MNQARIKLTGTDPEKINYVKNQLYQLENLQMEKEKLLGKNGNFVSTNV